MSNLAQRQLWSTSPSAITNFYLCPRQWYYNYVLRVARGPVPEHMVRGTAIHAGIEHYLKTGEVLIDFEVKDDMPGVRHPVMEYVQACIPHLPKPIKDPYWDPWREKGDGGLMIEQPGFLGTWSDPDGSYGPEFRQYIDLVEAYPDRATITDHKTTSDFRYIKTPNELSKNVQLISNAKWLFTESDYKELTLRHLNILAGKGKRPKAVPVEVVVTREHVEAEWQKILTTIREMAAWVKLGPETADPLPPNTEACNMYPPGCAHKVRCGFEKTGDLVSIRKTTKGERMGLLDDMAKRAAMKAAGEAAPAMPGWAAPEEPKPAEKKMTIVLESSPAPTETAKIVETVKLPETKPAPGGLLALLSKKAPAEAPAATEPALTPEKAQEAAVAAGYPVAPPAGYDPNGICPPDMPSPISTPEEVAAANGESANGEVETPAAAPTEAPTKRKRRTKAEMEAARAAEADEATKVEEAPAEAQPATASPSAPANDNPILSETPKSDIVFGTKPTETLRVDAPEPKSAFNFGAGPASAAAPEQEEQKPDPIAVIRERLTTPDAAFRCGAEVVFIDCMPGKGWPGEKPVDAIEFVHAFNALAAESAGVADYRLIRYESRGYLATAIRVYMAGLPTALYVDSKMSGADLLLETIIPYCKMVFRGVR